MSTEEPVKLACYEPVMECLAQVRAVQSELHEQLEEQKRLAAKDRVQIARLLVLVGRLLEGQDKSAADDLVVASNLAESIARADAITGESGAAADAGLRSGS